MLQSVIRSQFLENKFETDTERIRELKRNAELTLSNYLLYERSQTDARFSKAREQSDVEIVGKSSQPANSTAVTQPSLSLVCVRTHNSVSA